jgi:hypothetical protein
MLRGNMELWAAFIVMVLITALYGVVIFFTRNIPPAGELFGHGLGIVGFLLMLMTETLYSLRKRSRGIRWGRMSTCFNCTSLPGWWVLIWCCYTPHGNSMALPALQLS